MKSVCSAKAASADDLFISRLCYEKHLFAVCGHGSEARLFAIARTADLQKREVGLLIHFDRPGFASVDVDFDLQLVLRLESEPDLVRVAQLSRDYVIAGHHQTVADNETA